MIEFWTKGSKENERFQFSHEDRTYIDKLTKLNNCLLDSCSKCCLAFEGFRALIMYFVIGINNGGICDHSIELFNGGPSLEARSDPQGWLAILFGMPPHYVVCLTVQFDPFAVFFPFFLM